MVLNKKEPVSVKSLVDKENIFVKYLNSSLKPKKTDGL